MALKIGLLFLCATFVNVQQVISDESSAGQVADQKLEEREAIFNKILDSLQNNENTPFSLKLGAHHQLNFLPPRLQSIVRKAEYYNDYIQEFVSGLSETERNQILFENSKAIDVAFENETPQYPDCGSECDPTNRYRTYDGKCNNIKYCVWGAVGTTLRRLLPPKYGESNAPRQGAGNAYFLGTKGISMSKRRDKIRITSKRNISQMAMAFGQNLAHDISATVIRSVFTENGQPVEVDCTNISPEMTPPDCFILQRGRRMKRNFVRSAPGLVDNLDRYVFGAREQMNAHTAFLDGSHIYGTSVADRNKLYDAETGKLKTQKMSRVETEEFPPTEGNQYCESKDPDSCFISGDNRMNVNFGTMLLHTLILREHNDIAEKFGELTDWNGEKIFEETRRIVAAVWQKLTYVDYLPKILGEGLMNQYELNVEGGTTYDPQVDPSVINSFATAAFRFGHSQIYNVIRMARRDSSLAAKAGLFSTFFNTDRFQRSNNGHTVMTRYIMGLANDLCDAVDLNFGSVVVRQMFKSKRRDRESHLRKGTSLPAINIQRGRDHGLPECGEFMDLVKEMTGIEPANFTNSNVRKSDLFMCGLKEGHLEDAEIGLIFGTIIATQFQRLMEGDRFFYSHTNTDSATAFTADQRKEIEKVTLSSLICKHATPGQRPINRKRRQMKVAPDSFEIVSNNNPLTSCEDLTNNPMNLEKFTNA